MDAQGPSLSVADIAAFERRTGLSLPDEYKAFLLASNGGVPTPACFAVPGWVFEGSLVNRFHGIVPGKFDDLEADIELLAGRLPRGFIAIADDPGGNSVLIATEGPERGKVYFWDHESEPRDYTNRVADYPNIYFLAHRFDEFLRSLREEEPMDHPTLSVSRGDSVEAVQAKLGLTAPPEQSTDPEARFHFYRLADLGFWVFFDDQMTVYSIRFDAPYPYPVDGVKIGDTKETVRRAHGNADRLLPLPGGERWIYDSPRFLRADFDPGTDRVEKIFR